MRSAHRSPVSEVTTCIGFSSACCEKNWFSGLDGGFKLTDHPNQKELEIPSRPCVFGRLSELQKEVWIFINWAERIETIGQCMFVIYNALFSDLALLFFVFLSN